MLLLLLCAYASPFPRYAASSLSLLALSHIEVFCGVVAVVVMFTFTFIHLADFNPKRLAVPSRYIMFSAFPANQTHNFAIASAKQSLKF